MKKLTLPASGDDIECLKAGDSLFISGELYSARDAAHRRMHYALQNGLDIPVALKGRAIYYMGPSPAPPGRVIGSCGPTTSKRMDKYTPLLIEHGTKVVIGKGERSQHVKEALKHSGSIYLVTFGGAGAYLSKCVKEAEVAAYADLGTEAIWRIRVENFPAVVAYDIYGGDLFEQETARYSRSTGKAED